MDTLEKYTFVEKFKNNRGNDTAEFKDCEGKMIIKQYSGVNSDNFVIKKIDGKRINFSFFKINGIYYVNINGEHIVDYRRFTNIQQISKLENNEDKTYSIKIKNSYIGDIIIHNCDPEMFQKSLSVMQRHMKNKNTYYHDFMYFVFN